MSTFAQAPTAPRLRPELVNEAVVAGYIRALSAGRRRSELVSTPEPRLLQAARSRRPPAALHTRAHRSRLRDRTRVRSGLNLATCAAD